MDKTTLFKNILATDAYIQVNCRLIQKLGIKEAIILYELLSEQHFFKDKGKLRTIDGEPGMFYATMDFLTTDTGLTQRQVSAAVKTLEENKVLVKIKYNGVEKEVYMPLLITKLTMSYGDRIKWFKVNYDAVEQLIKAGDGSGTVTENTIRKDAFIIYNKILAMKLNPTTAVVFSDILTSFYYTEMCDNLEDKEWFKYLQDNQAKRLGITRKTLVKNYLEQLIDEKLIEKKTMGSKNATYIRILWNKLYEMLGGVKIEDIEDGIVIKKEESEVERITKKLLDRVKDISGQDWSFNHSRCAFIEQRLEDGFNEEDMYNIIEYKYNDYKRIAGGKYFERRFNWTNLFGSNCETWISNMHNQKIKDENNLKLEALSLRIIDEVKRVSGLDWRLDESYYPLLQNQLDCGVSEDELVDLIKYQYGWKMKSEGKITKFTWNKVYGEFQDDDGKGYSCFATIKSMRNKKHKDVIATKGSTYDTKTKKFKMNTGKSKDNVETRPFTKEDYEYQMKMVELGEVY